MKSKHLFTFASVAMFVFALAFGIHIYAVGTRDRRERAYWKKLDRILSDAKFEGSYLLARDGKIIASGGRGTVSTEKPEEKSKAIGRDSTVAINSLTKQFTGVAIYQLLNEGKLRLDAPIGTYLSDCPYGSQVTVQQLLEMQSGIPNFSNEQAIRDKYGDQIYSGMDPAALRADVMALQLNRAPGEKFEYSNTNYYLLGLIIEAVSGERYEDYIQQHIIKQVGMRHTGFDWNQDEVRPYDPRKKGDGREFAPAFTFSAGEMTSTVIDLYLWQNYLYGGGFAGIVPQELFPNDGYHMGLNRKGSVFRHAGATHLHRSNMLYDTSTKEQVILLGRRPESDLNELTDALKEWLSEEEKFYK
ncbi:serine hydrolase domain-containing protein [Stomatobaculum longum]|uniref:serine hydrolase domain-containing protein n=1 Tax=Stomatobaculum longum TaxID=796942 RepID=UPI0028805778|nr:serine hydrolase domain-containing protein [Stomatobaculum longum]